MRTLIRALRKIKERVYDFIVSVYYFHDARRRNRKYVVLGDSHIGIGNRLIALANTYSWFGKDNISLVWAMDSWVPMPFEDLFEMTDAPGFEVISHVRNRWSRRLQIPMIVEKTCKWWQFWIPEALTAKLPKGNVFCLYNDIPIELRGVFLPFFRQLRPSAKVQERIAACKVADNAVRVQIRNSSDKHDAAGVASIKTFVEKMKGYPESQLFYVSCMNAEVSAEVRRALPGQIVELPNKNYSSMIDAVADMWLLGGGTEMICQRGSTFAEVAWWWRECASTVHPVDREYFQAGRKE